MKEGERYGTKIPSLEVNSDAWVSYKNGQWTLQFKDSNEPIALPDRVGKVLSLGIQLTNDALDKEKNSDRLKKFDCHLLVWLAFGFCTVKQIIEQKVSYNQAFALDYALIDSHHSFESLVNSKLEDENVGVLQIKNMGGGATHSSFVFKTKHKIYLASKAGFDGIVVFDDSEASILPILEFFGNQVAVEKYSVLFEKYGKKE